MTQPKKIEINVPASEGREVLTQGTTVLIDDEKIEGVYSVEISLDAGDITRLRVKSFVKKGGGVQVKTNQAGNRGLVRQSQTFSFSGSISVAGVLIDQETWVE